MSAPPPSVTSERGTVGGLLLKNTAYLTIAQVLTIPLAMVMNAALARYLGPAHFGDIYLAVTIVAFGFLAVEWGSQGALPAIIARDRSRASVALGSFFAWAFASGILVYVLLAGGTTVLGYGRDFQWVLALVFLNAFASAYVASCKDTMRGFERTDIPAVVHVGQQLLAAALVVLALVLGGDTRAALSAQAAASVAVLFVTYRTVRRLGVGPVHFDRDQLKGLLKEGAPFVFFALAMTLQPYIDALYLSKLAPPDVMGYHAVARRLIGVLLLPATALIGALYPTLCRLNATDPGAFVRTASDAMRSVSLVAVPIALGCGLYPQLGVAIFDRQSFGPAEDNLRVLSIFLLFVYVTMPIGTTLLAAGRQRAWTGVQALCVLVSLGLDPLLIPIFQERLGNGGVGVSLATLASEMVVFGFGLWLAPKGVLNRRLLRSVALALVAGVAMAGFAYVTRTWSAFLAAPLAISVYVVVLLATGGVDKDDRAKVWSIVGPKLARLSGR